MKRHLLRVPNKARLWTSKNTVIFNNDYTIKLYTYGNQSGFVHLAEVYKNFELVASAKAQYYNRTWERFTGESVYKEALNYAVKSGDITSDITVKWILEVLR